MDTNRVRKLQQHGHTIRQIARETGWPLEEVRRELAAAAARRRRRQIAALAVVVVVAVVVSAVYVLAWQALREPDAAEWSARLRHASAELGKGAATRWLIEGEGQGLEALLAESAVAQQLIAQLEQGLVTNSAIPEVARLKLAFGGRMYPTVFWRGISRQTFTSGQRAGSARRLMADPQAVEIVLYGRASRFHPRINDRLMFYDLQWRALFISAVHIADPLWFGALAAHELFHAQRHREGAASSHAPMFSDLWIAEELSAHRIEEHVLNHGTAGRYGELVREVVDRRQARSLARLYRALDRGDFERLNRLFQPADERENSVRVAQYALSVSGEWLRRRFQGPAFERHMSVAYRILVTHTGSEQ